MQCRQIARELLLRAVVGARARIGMRGMRGMCGQVLQLSGIRRG
jgi:hypothetical protein